MNIDHIALNAVSLDEEIGFFVGFLGLKLLQRWDELRQAYVGFEDGPMIGLVENPQFDGTASTKAHLAFQIPEADFDDWVRNVQAAGVEIVTGPKPTRRGRTILFRTPGRNIIEICYPPARETIAAQTS
jgi:catechol 2,3-dioxygenase-like lactoylglutathione lyase family enzyme